MKNKTAKNYMAAEERLTIYQAFFLAKLFEIFNRLEVSWQIITGLSMMAIGNKISMSQIRELQKQYDEKDESELIYWLSMPYIISTERVWDLIIDKNISDLRESLEFGMYQMVEDVVPVLAKQHADMASQKNYEQYVEIMRTEIKGQKWSKKHYNHTIWDDTTRLKDNLQSLLSDLRRGQITLDEATLRLSRWHRTSTHQARRMLYTEFSAMNARVQKQIAIHNGIEKFVLVAVLDNKTSEICKTLDGTEGFWATAEIGIDLPPFHPWCRTVAVYVN